MIAPEITIIIPTRERASVLEAALRTATSQDYDKLKIIVSDNFSRDNTSAVVETARDSRIHYLNTGERLSMSHNWDYALEHVNEGWVTFMGDDDGLLPGAIRRVAEIIRKTKAQAIRTEFCTYDWPGMPEHPQGQLIVPLTSGQEWRDSRQWLYKVLMGWENYNQLPMIYNGGFVHISLLRRIRDGMGNFFSSVNPDVYSAVALAKLTDRFLFVREPLAISGTSKYSNGHSAFSVSMKRNAVVHKEFLSEGNKSLHSDVPPLPGGGFPLSLQVCVYEAYLQSIPLGKQMDVINHRNQLAIILATSGKHRGSIDEWGRLFASSHGLDYIQAQRIAARLRPFLQARMLMRKLGRVAHSVVVDRLMLRNVYEASVAAGVIRANPGRWDSAQFLLQELQAKLRKIFDLKRGV